MKRSHGDGSIDPQGPDRWRIRYRVAGVRHAKTIKGSRTDAAKALRQALKAADDGRHVAPGKMTLAQWAQDWLDLRSRSIEARTLERYSDVLRLHILPHLGALRLQAITATDIDRLHDRLTLAPRTLALVHTVLKACLRTAVKKKLLAANPADDAERPKAPADDAGTILDETELGQLVRAFAGSSLYPIVATAAYTGARRNEILALRWIDVDLDKRTISITRSVEETKAHGRRVKGPKTARGKRTIEIDEGLAALLRKRRGIGEALVFPGPGGRLKNARSFSSKFAAQAKALGFKIRFHSLRASHATALLDRGQPVHVVAARIGDDPATLLKWYAKRTKKADSVAAGVIGELTRGIL